MNKKILLNEKIFCSSLFLSTLVLFPDVPLWAFASALVFWIWRLMLEFFDFQIPSRFLTGFISVLFLVATFTSFRTFIGKEASSCFLIILSSLKFLEYREESEKNFLTLLGFFLICAKFLFTLDLIYAVIEVPIFFILLHSLMPVEFQKKSNLFQAKWLGRFVLASLPMTVFLYIFFPRFSQNWMEYQTLKGSVGISGMSDEVRPGSVSKVIESNEVAFRAEFQGDETPLISNLYWRGDVLTHPEGLTWKHRGKIKYEKLRSNDINETNWTLKVTLEPHFRNWVFALEGVSSLKSDQLQFYKNEMGVYSSQFPIDKRSTYVARWKNPEGISSTEEWDSKLPRDIVFSAEILKLVKGLSSEQKSPEVFAKNLMDFYKNEFRYTLNPGDKGQLSLDDFIFKSKKGFCEHFASSSALLFLAAGYPARVVSGYQGGTFNRYGNFWTIQQKDAHAWTEYLDSQKRWQRFDATQAVAPLRLELGATYFYGLKETDLAQFDLQNFKRMITKESWFEEIGFWFENLNYKWNLALLDYDLEKQKEMFNELGIDIGKLALFGLIIALSLSMGLNLAFKKAPRANREIILARITKFFEAHGMEKKYNEGPLHWQNRLIEKFPQEEKRIEQLLDCYIQEAYAFPQGPKNLKKVKRLLAELKI